MRKSSNKNQTHSNSEKKPKDRFARERANRGPAKVKPVSNRTPLKDHKNPIIRALFRTGYTVWLVVMGIGILIAFVVSVAVL